MGYVAVKGGRQAIENAAGWLDYQRVKGRSTPLEIRQITEQMYLAVDRVMGEGGVYDPDLCALALKQAAGDTFEAAFLVRAFRTTQPRIGYSLPGTTHNMRILRRISATFKNIPGGQILGPTPDYTLRLLNFDLRAEGDPEHRAFVRQWLGHVADIEPAETTLPKVVEMLRQEGLLVQTFDTTRQPQELFDVTRQAIRYPTSRSATLQTMARGETGGLLALAYSNMRGYGNVHPAIGELRVGYLPLAVTNPYNGNVETIGEVKVTEVEVIAHMESASGIPRFTLGYGLCFGHNETKAISMAVLDRAMQQPDPSPQHGASPSEDPEFVLTHVDGIESMGFCNHYKLPHYVTFQSDLDRLRKARDQAGKT